MNNKTLNHALGTLAVSALILSPALGAVENPFELKSSGASTAIAEVVPVATPKNEPPMKSKEGMCAGKMKGMMDSDKDGKISKDEFIKHHEQMFGMMDKNKDGSLDDAEMAQMSEMMKSMGGGMGGMGGMDHGGGMGGPGGMGGMNHGAGGMEGMKPGTEGTPKQ